MADTIEVQERASWRASEIAAVVAIVKQLNKKVSGDVAIYLVGNRAMRRLNAEQRGCNQPTDVLSFAWREAPLGVPQEPLGELYLAPQYIKAQARRFKVQPAEEFVRSLVHGLLHLGGYDHVKKREAEIMFARQERTVQKALKGIANKRTV